MKRRWIESIYIIFFAVFIQLGYAAFQINVPLSIGIVACLLYIVRYMFRNGEIVIPRAIIYMLLWLIFCFCNALFISPVIIGHNPKLLRIGYEAVYFLHLLVYMIVGYLITKKNNGEKLLRYIAYFAAVNSSLAILSEISNLSIFREIFYLSGAGIRFCGIAANPNDFMVQTLTGVAYFLISRKECLTIRLIALICLIYSTFAAGSKGGIVAIGVFAIIIFQNWLSGRVATRIQKKLVKSMVVIIVIVAAIVTMRVGNQIGNLILKLQMNGGERIADFFFDPLSNLDTGGSSRIKIWTGTIMAFMSSPWIGCGIGSHERVQIKLEYSFAELGTPHNIYLELLEQCGVIGFIIIAIYLYKILKELDERKEFNRVLKGAVTILLINGMFFASDWSITFWIVLGAIFAQIGSPLIHIRVLQTGRNSHIGVLGIGGYKNAMY